MSNAAAEHVTVTYEIWIEDLATGRKTRSLRPDSEDESLRFIQSQANRWNAEQAENARIEMRPVNRRFYVVTATTTRVELTD